MEKKVCLVTGASRGIGRRLAVDFAREGASVALVARPSAKLGEALEAARAVSERSIAVECDVSERSAVERMVAQVYSTFGRIDVLVNSAAIEPISTVADSPVDDIERTIRTNYLGMVYCVKAVLPTLRAQQGGCIVNLSSTAGRFPLPRGAAYAASKAAISAFSESLYYEVKKDGVQVLVVYPGFVPETEMAQEHMRQRGAPPRMIHQSLEKVSQAVRAAIGTNRFEVLLPSYLSFAGVFKELFPAISRRQVERMEV